MAKTPKKATPAKAKTTKEPKATKAKAEDAPKIFNTPMDEENRKLFLHHLPKIKALKDKQARATADLRNGYKTAKAEGSFTKEDFETAIQIEDAEREAKTKARIARQLVIARYMGKSLGSQLELFMEPDRTPSSDIAFDEGKKAALSNEPAKPSYDPSTEQYRRYMEGYHSVSEGRVKSGIKPLHPEVAADQEQQDADRAKIDGQKAEDAEAFDEPPAPLQNQTSGVPTSRAQFLAAQQREREQEGSSFSKRN